MLPTLKRYHWKSIWAGDWTVLPCSDWGEHYVTTLKVCGKPFVRRVIFIFQDGKVSAWVTEEDIHIFHDRMVKMVGHRLVRVKRLARNLTVAAKAALRFMGTKHDRITPATYRQYRHIVRQYYNAHMPVKYFADALSGKELDTFLPILQKARIAAESVFTKTKIFDRSVVRQVGKETQIPWQLLLDVTRDELLDIWNGNSSLPKALSQRHAFSALVFTRRKPAFYSGRLARQVQAAVTRVDASQDITGQTAYPGKISGRVRIVLDPTRSNHFREGDVLVTRMTRPEFLPLMKKASGFVTDAGGILSHAAITAREMKKPCIIGTKVATQVLKDGDRVEVDAVKGVVRKL